jgi:two-component system OmpR family sensor kinase
MKWRWLLLLIPFGLGLLLAALLNQSELPNPTYRVLISLSSLLLLLGILLSIVMAFGQVVWRLAAGQNEQKMARLQTEATEDRRRFLQRLDHELKNPLMAIRAGLANFANAPTPETRQSALATVDAQTVRLSRLTTDLRKIAELESRPLERGPVDLEQLLVEVVEANQNRPEAAEQPGLGHCQINLIVPQAPWPLPTIYADWDLVYLAVHNLLDNAQKFSRPGCAIEVRGREDGRFVVVEVADTGPGIDAEDLPHVWEELYRGQGGRSVQGSGLGLALVKAIVDRHGGVVSIDSKIDQGTVVTMSLPKTAAKGL